MKQPLCIVIHGFAGNPWEVEPLAHALERSGFEVITPLLPGHDRDKKRMEKITALEWLQAIEKIVTRAKDDKKEIHLIGFSMGAMIASITASKYPISSLVLLSPAVYVLTPHVFKMRLERFRQLRKRKPEEHDQALGDQTRFTQKIPLANVFQFHKVVRQAKRIFHNIHVPICIIHGKRDETIDPKSAELIFHAAASKEKELHYLPHARHHICQGDERDQVIQFVTLFLDKHRTL
ncbi:alpha/beta hydrolase [Sporolactobacillus inulinus]|jgi:esterase/lipase|uniref:Carboxylesterase n=1 Tax=Sporolactobacillus inulinus CASD TaxID=1069536 RepID=A0A0U1QPD1_9BACL|nr:alpha/beta fold hydrolase [Sporolactobacillus inulinus]KLI02658.1 carboxylesterase [Sporolactobacillus inulinus CASD]GEB77680.1 carboxylesterase [Sporolactobacillus inulinus]